MLSTQPRLCQKLYTHYRIRSSLSPREVGGTRYPKHPATVGRAWESSLGPRAPELTLSASMDCLYRDE